MSNACRPLSRMARFLAPLILALVLVFSVTGAAPIAQDPPTDEEIYAGLKAVILDRTYSAESTNTVIEIPARQDTFIASNKPNQNFGQDSSLRLGYQKSSNAYGALRPFIQFDVAAYIPQGATINRATMQSYEYYYTPAGDSPMRSVARHLLQSWSENSVTWHSHQPDWGSEIGHTEVGARYGWGYTDVSSLVREWLYGTHPNHGMLLIGDENVQDRERRFYSLNANNTLYPRLVIDYTFYVDTTPPQSSVDTLPAWSQTSFPVTWSGTDPGGSGIAYFEVQYNVNGGSWIEWIEHTTSQGAEFKGAQNAFTYQFRCRAVDNSGNVEAWSPAQATTIIDSIPPAAWVNGLPQYTFEPSVEVSWTGQDNQGGSGLATYDVQYREDGGPWQNWFVETTMTSAWGTGLADGTLYELRARGTDRAGNVQSFSPIPQTYTIVELSGPVSRVKPIYPGIISDTQFLVEWTAQTSPGTNIESFDIRYQFGNGPWINWLVKTKLTSEVFDQLNATDGSYRFQARAMDTAGRQEEWSTLSQATVYVDRLPPFLQPVSYMPIIYGDRTP